MAQSLEAIFFAGEQKEVDYTPSSALDNGEIVIDNDFVAVCNKPDGIDASALGVVVFEGIWKIKKSGDTGPVFSFGDIVDWDEDNDTAVLHGAGTPIGICVEDAATGDDHVKTLLGAGLPYKPGSATLAATGSAQGDAAAIVAEYTYVTAADGTKGVKLPANVAGDRPFWVYNTHASNGLKVYPNTGDDINDGTTNAAVTIEGKSLALFIPLDGTSWAAIFTANS